MEIEVWAANRLAEEMAVMLTGGHVDVFDQYGTRLARCQFAADAFAKAADGAVAAHQFLPSVAENDGRPWRFEARDFDDSIVLKGRAGYKDDQPAPQMKFRTRMIVQDADVLVESFIFSIVGDAEHG